MADCDDTLRELQTFLDGELTDEAVGTMQAHLDGCPDCLEAFDFHAELRSVIAAKCHDEMPPGLLVRLEQCLHADLDGDGRIG